VQIQHIGMVLECPKCGRTVPEDSTYCPYCGHGVKPCANTTYVPMASILMIVTAASSLVLFALSIEALLDIYNWYPQLTAQSWFIYDQLLTVFSCLGMLFGLAAAALSSARRSYNYTMISALVCAASGGAAWVTSMIVPSSTLLVSTLYYFLPTFFPTLIATSLIYYRRVEFKQKPDKSG
jgi:uncharacterized BrkB/YihY/UPF0761 family membrane protein